MLLVQEDSRFKECSCSGRSLWDFSQKCSLAQEERCWGKSKVGGYLDGSGSEHGQKNHTELKDRTSDIKRTGWRKVVCARAVLEADGLELKKGPAGRESQGTSIMRKAIG